MGQRKTREVLLHYDAPLHSLVGNPARPGPAYANPPAPRAGEAGLNMTNETEAHLWGD